MGKEVAAVEDVCPNCNDNGIVECVTCNINVVIDDCSVCNGKGYVACDCRVVMDAESFDAEESRREWTFLWKPKNEGWGNSVYAPNLKGAKEQVLKTYPKGSSFFQRADLSTLTDDSIVNKQRWRNWDSQWNADDESFKYGCSKCKQFFNTWCQCEEWYGIESPQSNWYEANAESFDAESDAAKILINYIDELVEKEIANLRERYPDENPDKDGDIKHYRKLIKLIEGGEYRKAWNMAKGADTVIRERYWDFSLIEMLRDLDKLQKGLLNAESFGAEYEPPKMKDGDLIDFGDGHGYIKIGSHGRYNRDGSMISPVKSMHCGSNGIYVLIGNITGQSTFVLFSQDKEKLKQKYREYSNFDEWHDFETKKDADSWWKSNRLEDILEKSYSSLHVVLLKEVIEAMHDPNRINVGTTEKDGKYADGTPRFMMLNAENWGGDPEGPLAKALEKARKKSKKSKKPLKIEKLDSESFEAEDNDCCRVLKDVLEIIDPLDERGHALVEIHRDWRPEMQRWLIRLKEDYTDWECPDGFWDEYYGAESFSADTIKTGVICGDKGCKGELLETEYGKASKVHCNKCDYSEIMEWDAESFSAECEACGKPRLREDDICEDCETCLECCVREGFCAESFAAHLPCYFCGKEAQTEKGVLYYRTQLPGGKWGSVEICLPCLEHINKVKEGKWIKRTDPNNPQRFYYSKGDRLDYDAKTKKHGAYIRSGGGYWNEQQNAKGRGYDNRLGKLVKLPNHLTKDFLSNSKTSHKKGITSKRGMGFVLGGIALVLVAQRGLKK